MVRRAMISRAFNISNKLGLHARPSAQLTQTAARFQSDVWIAKDGRRVNAKSIMGVMMLAAGQGSIVTVDAEGPDEAEAIEAVGGNGSRIAVVENHLSPMIHGGRELIPTRMKVDDERLGKHFIWIRELEDFIQDTIRGEGRRIIPRALHRGARAGEEDPAIVGVLVGKGTGLVPAVIPHWHDRVHIRQAEPSTLLDDIGQEQGVGAGFPSGRVPGA